MEPQGTSASQAQVEAFGRRHRTDLVTLVFTDMVGSTALKQQLGDHAGAQLIEQHHALVRAILKEFPDGDVLSTAGDSFFLVFATPSAGVKFALVLQQRLRELSRQAPVPVRDRMGLHLGEVLIQEAGQQRAKDLIGLNVDLGARVMGLAQGGQILLTRAVFDSARQALKGEDIPGVGPLNWLNHGLYQLKGIEEAVEICEVGEVGAGPLHSPATTEKARRVEAAEGEAVLGWRPAVGQAVPNTQWVLEKKLGEGGFGEVWLGRHQAMKERRVFKFCFRADRVRSLKREMTLFRVLKERVGDHPNIVRLLEVNFEEPPFYVVMDHVEGEDLKSWCDQLGGAEKVPLAARLEIVAQIADALQAAHDAGVIHRDVKPGNILIADLRLPIADWERRAGGGACRSTDSPLAPRPSPLVAKLTDFGIGQVVSEEALKGVTKAGFTQTIIADSSSSQTGSQMYMAPELLAGKPASTRSDIYSLGVVLYQSLVGDFTRPITTDWQQEVTDPLLRDDLKHCFAGNPQDRFAGAGQFAKNLRALPERRAALERQQVEQAERERLRQQAERRHKLLLAGSVVTLVLVALALALGYGMRKAQGKEEQQRRLAYAADMSLAQQALAMNDLGRAKRLLDGHRPRPGEPDLRGWEWRYLWRECRSDVLSELCRHSNDVSSVAYSPDGKTLAVAGLYQHFVEIWDVPGRRRIATLQTNAGQLVAFSPRGNLLATDNAQGGINIWQADTTNLVRQITDSGYVKALKFSPDGARLASLNNQGEVAVWNVDRWVSIRRIPGPKGPNSSHNGVLDFSRDGNALVIGHGDNTLRVVDLDTGSTRFKIPAHREMITAVAWSPKAPILASGSGYLGGPIRLWDANSGDPIGDLEGHTSWITRGLIFSADGQLLYSASGDQTIRIWDVREKRCLAILRGSSDEVYGLALSPDGTTLASGSKDGVVAFWSALPHSKEEQPRPLSMGQSGEAAFAPDGRVLALPREGIVHLYELPALRELDSIAALGTNVSVVAYSSDGTLIVSGSTTGWLRVWSCAERRLLKELPGLNGTVWWLRFSGDGTRLLSADYQGELICWNSRTWQRIWSLVANNAAFASVSPDDRLAVAREGMGQLSWWNTASGKALGTTAGHRFNVRGATFSPDGTRVASVAEDGTVALWDTSSSKAIRTFRGHMLGTFGVAFSPDGRRLATCSIGREAVKVWDLATYRELVTLPGPWFLSVSFSPDGNWLAARSTEGQLHLWHAPPLVEIEATDKAEDKRP